MDRINYLAPADTTGYACAAAQYLQLLRETGAEVHFQPLVPGRGFGLWYDCAPGFEAGLMKEALTILHTVPEYYAPLTRWLRERGASGKIAGCTVWETNRLPRHWPAVLNSLDAVIVPSSWNREVFQSSGVTVPLFCLPHLSEFEGRSPGQHAVARMRARLAASLPRPSDSFLFYSIGAWSHRKGNDLLLAAFRKAFRHRPEVALVLKTTPASLDVHASRWQRLLGRGGMQPRPRSKQQELATDRIVLLTEDLPADDIAALHTLGDCYVSCARGEGWGLGLYEAVWFGKPFLAPDQGGHRAYLANDQLAGLIPSRPVAVRVPGTNASYTPDQQWNEIDLAALERAMRQSVDNPLPRLREAETLAVGVRTQFGRQAVAGDLRRIIQKIVVQKG